ncbi:MAG: MoaD/ThiS family protein [Anaerolineaceae bacterium]|nr:MoaD/ThiS family protein [Anaerolineaceae bacterium]
MPILRIPTPLRAYVSGQAEVNVSGTGVFEALSDLTTQHPAIFNENAVLRPFVNLFIGQDNIEDLQGTATSLKDGEKIAFGPSIARG